MHLLILGLNYAPESVGVGKYTTELAQWLVAQGHRVSVVCAPPHYPSWRISAGYAGWRYTRSVESGVEVIRCPAWMPRRLTALQRILTLFSFTISSWIPLIARARRADLIMLIEPTLLAAPGAVLLGTALRRPLWLHVQDFELAAGVGSGYFGRTGRLLRAIEVVEAWLRRRFDRVSTLGAHMDQRLAAAGVPQSRRLVLPNWVDCARIRPLPGASAYRARLQVPEGTMVALYSGTFGRKHGLDLLVDVARELQGRAGLHFVFCGEGPEAESLRTRAAGLTNVTWLPLQPLEELNDLLNLADVHLLPQLTEVASAVLPSKLTGMLASGRPVVATAEPGTELAELVSRAGIVISGRNVRVFARAIMTLAEDAALRARLGRAARELALNHFDKDAVLGRYDMAIRQVGAAHAG